jgi:ATP adenylyltransferase
VTSPDAEAGAAHDADAVSGGAGVADAFDRIWAPHRMSYISGASRPAGDPNDPNVCPFCVAPSKADDEGLIVARGDLVYAVLNLYPYNAGHLLVVPYRHTAEFTALREGEAAELTSFTQRAVAAIARVAAPQGFNVGMNLGSVAGAGVAAHLHQHVVPRWGGDTNFMPVVGRTRVLAQMLGDTRELLAAAWAHVGD